MTRFMPLSYSGAWNPAPVEKDHKTTEPIITTNHCLNCDKSHRGECEHYTKLSAQLFATKVELDDRINEYKKLALEKGCEV